ncbi:MAG: hypothetical protein GY852_06905 [bacterium]|nr:hypothetical protein [bacterium]
MIPSRKIHANPNSISAPKNSKHPEKFRFSAAKLMVAHAIVTVAVAGVISVYGCPEGENPSEPERMPAASPLTSQDSFTVTKTERISVHNSLKILSPGISKSLALVVDTGKKVLENDPRVLSGDGYSHMIDEFIEIYGIAGGEMMDAAIAQSEKLPESERAHFLDEAYLTIVALLLRPYAAWEGPSVLKKLDQQMSSREFSLDSLDRFAADNDLVREYYELTLKVGNQIYF